jgi:hypothetical protein
MGRFSDIQKGKRARRLVEFPLANTRCSLLAPLPELEAQRTADAAESGTALSGGAASGAPAEQVPLVALVVLTGEEEAIALAGAREFAVKRGVVDPKPDDPIYDLGLIVHTLLLGCVDPESPVDAPVPFFTSAEQILKNLNREQTVHLHAQHEFFQDETSPRAKRLSNEEFLSWLVGVAESESPSDFFEKLGPAMLFSCVRTLTKLHALSQTDRLQAGSTTALSGKDELTPMAKGSGSTEGGEGG